MKSQGKVSIILLTQTAIIQALTKTGEKNFKKLCIFLKKFPLPHPLSEFILELFSVRTAGGAFFQYTIHIINFTTYVRVKKNRRHIQNQPISTYLESKNPPLLCTILYIYIILCLDAKNNQRS